MLTVFTGHNNKNQAASSESMDHSHRDSSSWTHSVISLPNWLQNHQDGSAILRLQNYQEYSMVYFHYFQWKLAPPNPRLSVLIQLQDPGVLLTTGKTVDL